MCYVNELSQSRKLSRKLLMGPHWLAGLGKDWRHVMRGVHGRRFAKDLVELNIRDAIECRPRYTFFLSNLYSNPHRVQTLNFMGQELGLRTVDGEFDDTRTVKEWGQQVQAGYFWMERLVNYIGREDVEGFRAPFLGYTEELFTALRRQNVTYDSSFIPKQGRYWPFTLDAGAPDCADVQKCPPPTAGLWEFPLNYLTGDDYPDNIQAKWAKDPTPEDTSADAIRDLLALNFDKHYSGDRAPLGIHINTGWVVAGNVVGHNRILGVMDFLRFVSTQENVVFASPKQVISWMKNPTTSLEELKMRPEFECPRFPWPVKRWERTCDGRDDDDDGLVDEGFVKVCRYKTPSDLSFSTCKRCPRVYPNLDGPPVEDCQLDPDTVEWWCERNGGYELGTPVHLNITGTLVGLDENVLGRLLAAWSRCGHRLDLCRSSQDEGIDDLDEGAPTSAPSNEDVISTPAEAPTPENLSNFERLSISASLANMTAILNGTEWSIYEIDYVVSQDTALLVADVLGRVGFNLTVYISPDSLEIKMEGRFFRPRRGPTIRLSGSINPTFSPPRFTASGTFNYALFAPKIPDTDPRQQPPPPPDDDDDYDYDFGPREAPSPPPPSPPPPPEEEPSQAGKPCASLWAVAIPILFIVIWRL
ncbi:hypothetical protein BSKO_00805 [Bryopsis sp. KO-2023]|nr:hypothetical protein BSKO_00805 [Bryopsis sp. KO-2023]